MSSSSDSTTTQEPAPQRPAWLNFEQEEEEEAAAAEVGAAGPRITEDPRGAPSTDRSKAVSVAMEEDELKIEGQRYAIISFVSPNGTFQHADHMILKIRGVFATLKQARERAEIIKSFDPVFDLFIIDMWKWIPFPPKPNIHREGEDRVTDMLNNFFERTEASQAEMRQRVEATRELGKQRPPSSSSSSAAPGEEEAGPATGGGGGDDA